MITKEIVAENKKLAKKYPKFKTELWLCSGINKAGKAWSVKHNSPVGVEGWRLYSVEVNGYKWATKRVPYFSDEELMELTDIKPVDRENLVLKALL